MPFIPLTPLSIFVAPFPPFPTFIETRLPAFNFKLTPNKTPAPPPPPPNLPPPPPPPTINISQIIFCKGVKVYNVCPVNPGVSLV